MKIYQFKLDNGKIYAEPLKRMAKENRDYFVKMYGKDRVGQIEEVESDKAAYQFGLSGSPNMWGQ